MGYVFSAYPCPSSSLRLPLSFLFPLPSSPPYLPLEVGPLKYSYGGLGERCKLFKRGLERSRSGNRILCILALKPEIWCYRIYHFFLRINRPQCVKSAAKFGGLAGIWRACAQACNRHCVGRGAEYCDVRVCVSVLAHHNNTRPDEFF